MNLDSVITEKHTKLRGLLVLKQKKRKKRERGRGNSNGVVERGSQTRIYKVRGRVFFEKKERFERRFEKIWKEIERRVSF